MAVVGFTIWFLTRTGGLTGGKEAGVVGNIYVDANGKPKYALGVCVNDNDCTVAGCSSQLFSSDPKIATTCEIRDDFPDKSIYSCGCVQGRCVWSK